MDARACLPRPSLRVTREKVARLTSNWQQGAGQLRLAKSTISNLFRYQPRGAAARRVSLGEFNHVLAIDAAARTVEVEGLTTYETVVRHCLEHGFLPLVAPELKHITVGGATVGIGIESTCFRYGFVHDGLREADVLLPGGKVVTARADNEHADLFNALPNSYGTLGYILRAKIALHPAKPYVHLHMQLFRSIPAYLDAMEMATRVARSRVRRGAVLRGRPLLSDDGPLRGPDPADVDDIVRKDVFYRLVEKRRDIYLTTFDYIFRYDPDWFWNVPETGLLQPVPPLRARSMAQLRVLHEVRRDQEQAARLDRYSRRTHRAADPGLGSAVAPRRRADPLRDRQRESRRATVGRGADQSAAPAHALPDQAERALLQPRLLLPGAAGPRA